MKKIYFTLDRQIITALVNICRTYVNLSTEDTFYNLFVRETLTDLLLRLARYRNRTQKKIKLSFALGELIVIREITDLHRTKYPDSYEVIMLDNYLLNSLPSLSV